MTVTPSASRPRSDPERAIETDPEVVLAAGPRPPRRRAPQPRRGRPSGADRAGDRQRRPRRDHRRRRSRSASGATASACCRGWRATSSSARAGSSRSRSPATAAASSASTTSGCGTPACCSARTSVRHRASRTGFRAIALIPLVDGTEIDVVTGKARSGSALGRPRDQLRDPRRRTRRGQPAQRGRRQHAVRSRAPTSAA